MKTKRKENLSLRVPTDTWKKIQNEARKNGQSVGNFLIKLLADYPVHEPLTFPIFNKEIKEKVVSIYVTKEEISQILFDRNTLRLTQVELVEIIWRQYEQYGKLS